VHAWADRLKPFLADRGVLPGTHFTVFPDGWKPGMEWRPVEVYGEDGRRTDDPSSAGRSRRSRKKKGTSYTVEPDAAPGRLSLNRTAVRAGLAA
jgi:hypothetical protein